jgi:hypothetical protein
MEKELNFLGTSKNGNGPPSEGKFEVADFCLDDLGRVWVCTEAGAPGKWTQMVTQTEATVLKSQLAALPSGAKLGEELEFNREMLSEFLVATMRC